MPTTNTIERYTAEQAAAYRRANRDFPLFWHKAGGWAKKIGGGCSYFGRVPPQEALDRYHAERDYLERGELPPPRGSRVVTVRDLANRFLASKKALVASGELSQATWDDYKRTLDAIVACLGGTARWPTWGPMTSTGYARRWPRAGA